MVRKVCVVVTARPSYARIKTVLHALHQHPGIELQLVVAASAIIERYGNVAAIMEEEGFPVTARVHSLLEGDTLVGAAKSTGIGMSELASVFEHLRPDLVVTVADRYETLATAAAAAYNNVPLAHIQGGEITGSIDEKVRHAVTKLADLHFVSTERARDYVIRMGEHPDRVFWTGCPSIDIARQVLETPRLDFQPLEQYGGVGPQLDLSQGYLVVMQHPVTTEIAETRHHIGETVQAIKALALPTLWFWPNVDAGSDTVSKILRTEREHGHLQQVHFFRNMSPEDFLYTLLACKCLIGNSSVGIRECAYLGVPSVNIGNRQRFREQGRNVIDVAYDRRAIIDAVERQIANGRHARDEIYGDGTAGIKIADLLERVPLTIDKHLSYADLP
jgi:GDP/UDP-N,N'-diacetylbacillosamine 2-epimerase (hydrolysing)